MSTQWLVNCHYIVTLGHSRRSPEGSTRFAPPETKLLYGHVGLLPRKASLRRWCVKFYPGEGYALPASSSARSSTSTIFTTLIHPLSSSSWFLPHLIHLDLYDDHAHSCYKLVPWSGKYRFGHHFSEERDHRLIICQGKFWSSSDISKFHLNCQLLRLSYMIDSWSSYLITMVDKAANSPNYFSSLHL